MDWLIGGICFGVFGFGVAIFGQMFTGTDLIIIGLVLLTNYRLEILEKMIDERKDVG